MGFDCSGFVHCIYQVLGLTIRRSSRTIEDKTIFNIINSINDAKIGDIILFNTKNKITPSHCGIYIGNNKVIHCSGFVHISELANYRIDFVEDVLTEGKPIKVKVIGFDRKGKPKLSYRAVDQRTGEDISKRSE